MTAARSNPASAPQRTPRRSAFVVSDGTGITGDTLASALLARFAGLDVERRIEPFVDNEAAARAIVVTIDRAAAAGPRPIVFLTVTDPDIRQILGEADAAIVDLLEDPLHRLEGALAASASVPSIAPRWGTGTRHYLDRARAVEYTITHDDGQSLAALDVAELILLGPSRVGKTETALYLAVQFGLLVANIPLTDDIASAGARGLPETVLPYLEHCFGLSSTPRRLHEVRSERWPYSEYASLERCTRELRQAEALYRRDGIPFLNSAAKSVEEIASAVIHTMHLRTESF